MLFTLLIDFPSVKPGYLLWGGNIRVMEEVKVDKWWFWWLSGRGVCVRVKGGGGFAESALT